MCTRAHLSAYVVVTLISSDSSVRISIPRCDTPPLLARISLCGQNDSIMAKSKRCNMTYSSSLGRDARALEFGNDIFPSSLEFSQYYSYMLIHTGAD